MRRRGLTFLRRLGRHRAGGQHRALDDEGVEGARVPWWEMASPYRGVVEVVRRYGVRHSAGLAWREARYLVLNRLVQRSYSQSGEDRLAWELLGRRRGGCYVDLGCHDAVRLSNTYFLYRKGWRGVAVDAAGHHAARFARHRREDRFVAAGVGSEPAGSRPFYVHSATALSTFSAAQSARYAGQGHPCVEVVTVPVRTVADLLAEHVGDRPIDFLTVDLEGCDLEALASNDWNRFRPELVCVELHASGAIDDEHAGGDAAAIDELLTVHGYALSARRGPNAFYRRRSLSSSNSAS